ncbi:hypothetical protein RIF29_34032 [Crotalaria pallida]|uniref:Uncharacterized protein n=1 Tax=Crotalaria pallida TaxID=3830 RepID=A0AAN9EEA5_CROPI
MLLNRLTCGSDLGPTELILTDQRATFRVADPILIDVRRSVDHLTELGAYENRSRFIYTLCSSQPTTSSRFVTTNYKFDLWPRGKSNLTSMARNLGPTCRALRLLVSRSKRLGRARIESRLLGFYWPSVSLYLSHSERVLPRIREPRCYNQRQICWLSQLFLGIGAPYQELGQRSGAEVHLIRGANPEI